MKILFLHGFGATPGGTKPTFLKANGLEVYNPLLPNDDFDACVRIAQAEFDRYQPEVIVGSSRGGAVALNIDSGQTPLVLLCPAWKRWGRATTVKPNTLILHAEADEAVPFAHSVELVRTSGLPDSALIRTGSEHRLIDPDSLDRLLKAIERVGRRVNGRQAPSEGDAGMNSSFPADRVEKRRVLLQAVEQVRGTLAAQTDAAEEARTLPDASVAALREVGLFKLKLPAELGGAEADPVTQLEVIEAVTTINPSAGWCMFIGAAIVGMAGAFLPDETIASVFPDGRAPTMAGGLMPGRAVPEPGGYRVNGRWSWGSGIRHAEWVLVQTLVERDSPPPEVRAVVFPIARAQVIDNWHVLGMQGTGSCDYAVVDLFVPEAFTFAVGSTPPQRGGPLYLMGWPGYVANEHAACALGIARCALDAIIDLAQSKKRGYGPQRRLRDRAVFQRMIAQADLTLRGTRLVVIDILEKAWQTVSAGHVPGPALQAEMRSVATLATDVALEITTNAFRYGAGSAVRLEHVLQRCLRDVHTVAAHLMVNDSSYENYGQFLLGLPDVDPMG